MKLTVLVDNYTYINQYYFGEPALSFYIENEEDKILFDMGYSDIFMKNAELMNINIYSINKVVFSHGHNDHTGGLKYFIKNIDIISHPHTFNIRYDKFGEFGSFINNNDVSERYNFIQTTNTLEISKNLFYLGEIPQTNDFEMRKKMGTIIVGENKEEDYTVDDSALVYKGKEGLHIITGCSHSGICNIIEYAKLQMNDERVISVIGGFHLFECNYQSDKTVEYFKENAIKNIYPCHCTSLAVKSKINDQIEIFEVGVGMKLDFD